MTRPSAREAVSDALVLAERGLLETRRKPALLVFTFVEPVILILIFRFAFGGAIRTPNGSYVNFLMPGILVLTTIFGAIVTGIGLSEDLSKGIVDRLRSLPIPRSASSRVHTLLPRPKTVSFATPIASSTSATRNTEATGPNSSSRYAGESFGMSTRTVGA